MKAFFWLLTALVCLAACNGNGSGNKVKDSLPGIYTAYASGEFSEAWDTLIITSYDAKADTYLINKRTGYHRLVNGTKLPKEYKSQDMITVYNAPNQQLKEERTGRVFSFAAGKNQLLFGTAVYTKIKAP